MSFPSISIFSERSSPSWVRYAAPNTGAPLTAAAVLEHIPRGGERRGVEVECPLPEPVVPGIPPIAPESAPFLRARDIEERVG